MPRFEHHLVTLFVLTSIIAISHAFPAAEEAVSAQKSLLETRKQRIVQHCLKYANATTNDQECDALKTNEARKLIFDYKLYGCVPKGAGSRFWDATFNAITEDLMKRGSPDTPPHYVAFTTCRHPYQRIALAYAVEAKQAEKSGNKKLILPFTKFVEKTVITAGSAGNWKNPYLKPCHVDCNPCCTNFDVVSDYSTLGKDFEFIKHSQKLDAVKDINAHQHDGTAIEPTTLTRYFAALPKNLVEGIYRVYKKDFDLYGYTLENYL